MTDLRILKDGDALAQAGADLFVETASRAIAETGRFTVALSGGSTPRKMHQLLASEPLNGQVDWSSVHVYWGDERTVPPDDADSNYRMAKETLLDYVPIPESQIHRIQGEVDPENAATDYGKLLKAHFDANNTQIDLIFLGMGGDGHTASLFPHTEALNEKKHRCVANYVPKLATWRITMTTNMINSATKIVFLVGGDNKAGALKQVLQGDKNPHEYPSQLIKPETGELLWLVDETAAQLLT